MIIEHEANNRTFRWDSESGEGVAQIRASNDRPFWRGSLLPAFFLRSLEKEIYVDAQISGTSDTAQGSIELSMSFEDHGTGTMTLSREHWGIRVSRIAVEWSRPTAIVSMHVGTRQLTADQARATNLPQSFWPTWSAPEYCVPCVESNPTRSFWRSWNLGDATLPLGSFGDALGTPYAAAYPRPVYAAAMGEAGQWVSLGVGSIPDAALLLQLRASTGAFEWRYREDLWGAPDELHRTWEDPFRIAWGSSAYEAFSRLYGGFDVGVQKSPHHSRTFVCTWGDFKQGDYDLGAKALRSAETTPADVMVIDDHWESWTGSGVPHPTRFPNLSQDVESIRAAGFEAGFWEPVAWVHAPQEVGLTDDDLLCGIDGNPRRWKWSGNPLDSDSTHYLLDPASPKARAFLDERTARVMREFGAVTLKLDFGYSIPGPDVCTSRDPRLRGERLAVEFLRIIGDAARRENPDVTIIYYGVHPLLHDLFDLVSLDDLGDAGPSAEREVDGHSQRCMWAALAGEHGMPVNTSTGYFWEPVTQFLLDTAVVGACGITVGQVDRDGQSATRRQLALWHAILAWRRRATKWRPVWLDVDMGGGGTEPRIRSWAREEADGVHGIAHGGRVTAVVFRSPSRDVVAKSGLPFLSVTGDWAAISQDGLDLRQSREIALIPASDGSVTIGRKVISVERYEVSGHRLVAVGDASMPAEPCEVSRAQEESDDLAGFIVRLG